MTISTSLASLTELSLNGTGVSDAGLEGMRQLKTLFIAGAKVTPERIERFRKARPGCLWSPKYKEVKSEEDTRLIG